MTRNQVQLPEGYDDKTSQFYTPEELRDYYQACPPVAAKDISKVLERFARSIAHSRIPSDSTPREYWEEVDSILAQGDVRGATHVHYLQEAADRYERSLKYREREERMSEQSRCKVCGTVTLHTPDNPVARRSTRLLAPALIEQPGDLDSCLKCYLVVMETKTALAASEKVNKVPRRQLAEKVLDTL